MKVPKIRFKGFEGDWEERKLGELCTWISEKYWNRNDLEVFSVNNKTGFILQTEHFDNNEIASKDKSNYKIVTKKQFAYNPSRINVWSIAYLKNEDAVIVSPLYNIFECKKELNEMFLERFMKTFLFNKQRILNTEVSVRECLSFEGYCKIKIIKPETKEQEKIWSLFEQIDSHISKNQQKLEKLKNMKQSFLQKLFPKDWSALPELRFKGFEEAWEEKKLGESLMSIQTWTNLLWWNDEKWTPLLKMWNIQRWFFDLSKLEYIAPQLQVEQENIAYYWDFFFNTRNTLELVGKWATRMWENGKFAFNSNIARFKLKNINTIFFNYLYNTNEIKKQISARAMWTTSVAAIYPTNLYTVEYKIPSLPEQEKIWAFFEKLDTQITQQTQKIQKLQNLKQSLLEKMFI